MPVTIKVIWSSIDRDQVPRYIYRLSAWAISQFGCSTTTFRWQGIIQAFNQAESGVGWWRRAGILKFDKIFDEEWKDAIEKVHQFVDKHVVVAPKGKSPGKQGSYVGAPSTRYILLMRWWRKSAILSILNVEFCSPSRRQVILHR